MTIEEKFSRLGVDNAPGQESLQADLPLELLGDPLPGEPVDFSHGDVDAFRPAPGSLECFLAGVKEGARQAYTPYRGRRAVLEDLAAKLSAFTGCPIDPAGTSSWPPAPRGPCSWPWAPACSGGTRWPSWNRITSPTGR